MRKIARFGKILSRTPRTTEVRAVCLPSFMNTEIFDIQLKVNFLPLENFSPFAALVQKYYGFGRRAYGGKTPVNAYNSTREKPADTAAFIKRRTVFPCAVPDPY